MKTQILFALALFAPVSTFAATNVQNIYAASHLARAVSKIQSPQDVTKYLRLEEADRAAYTAKLKEIKNFAPINVTMPSETEVNFESGGQTLTFGFKEFEKGTLYIGKTKLSLRSKTSFNEMQKLVKSEIVNQKHASLWSALMPEANAMAGSNFMNYLGPAAALDPKFDLLNIPAEADIAPVVIEHYKKDVKMARDFADGRARLSMLVFTCKGDQLEKVTDTPAAFMGNAYERQETDDYVKFEPGKGYEVAVQRSMKPSTGVSKDLQFVKDGSGGYRFSANERGIITKSDNDRVPVGKEIFGLFPFFHFPLLAARCCMQTGCPEKVEQARKALVQEFIQQPESPKQDSGTGK